MSLVENYHTQTNLELSYLWPTLYEKFFLRTPSKQKALKSFSTDLAIELNQGFDETLSRQMQQKNSSVNGKCRCNH